MASPYGNSPSATLGQALLTQGFSTAPATGVGAAARVGTALAGALMMRRAKKDETERVEAQRSALSGYLSGNPGAMALVQGLDAPGLRETNSWVLQNALSQKPDGPPPSRTIYRDGMRVDQEWSRPTQAYVDVSTSPQFQERETSRQKPSAAEAEISRFMDAFNVSRQTAVKWQSGLTRIVTDPITGAHVLIDLTNPNAAAIRLDTVSSQGVPPDGEGQPAAAQGQLPDGAEQTEAAQGVPLDGAGQTAARQKNEEPTTLWSLTDIATGVAATLRAGETELVGQLPGVRVRERALETTRARQAFSVEANNLIRALSINPKFPVGEINRIREEIAITPSIFRSSEGLRERMIAVDEGLLRRLENERRTSKDPAMSATARQNSLQAANDIENFLEALGVPRSTGFEGLSNEELMERIRSTFPPGLTPPQEDP